MPVRNPDHPRLPFRFDAITKGCPVNLTHITVRYGRTQSLESYSNVRPEIILSAEIEPGDDPEVVKTCLLDEARAFVEEACDQALERDGQPAKFSTEPRYQLWRVIKRHNWRGHFTPPEEMLIITPVKTDLAPHDSGYNWSMREGRPQRIDAARDRAEELRDGPAAAGRIVDCTDGDLSRLPAWVLESIPEAPKPEQVTSFDDENDNAE